ncbi:hypothetical protein PENSPDRAFT_594955, partial [Peniophora sp. CONT]
MVRYKDPAPGSASAGVSVLCVEGRIGSVDGAPVNFRLDSGANISLMSEDLYASLGESAPRLQKGTKLRLLQLTSEKVKILGYVSLPAFMRARTGEILEFELEAYVVRNMTVPLLLGEDFQMLYSIGVSRSAGASCISFADSAFEVDGQSVSPALDHVMSAEVPSISWPPSKYGLLLAAERRQQELQNERHNPNRGKPRSTFRLARAAASIKIPAFTARRVRVDAPFYDDRTWLLEAGFLGGPHGPEFTVPNTLLQRDFPYVCVANPTARTLRLRQGAVVGQLQDPTQFLDKPISEERFR